MIKRIIHVLFFLLAAIIISAWMAISIAPLYLYGIIIYIATGKDETNKLMDIGMPVDVISRIEQRLFDK